MYYVASLSIPVTADAQDYVLVVEYTDVMQTTSRAFGVSYECVL